jgi:serine/threonine protein kinase
MADPRTPIAGRYVFAGLLKNSQATERWIGIESDTGRRVVIATADSGRLTTLDSARGVKHRHLTYVIEVVRDVDPASLPSGKPLPPGFGVAVAEFVPGRTLHAELAKGGMNPAKAVAWILRLADAVQALHGAGAVHAALSPRSVIAVPEGRAIAPVLSQLVAPSIGPFCPPERLKGSAETAPDDVWALHATLYTALTRQAPYHATTRDALLKQMLAGRPKPLSAFGIDEPALQEILDRGLSYEKRVRVTELAEFIQTLDGWERDPRAMPGKRQIPPRPAPRSLMDIVSGTGLGKGRDDEIVIDDTSLPDDEGTELNPKPAVSPPAPAPAARPVSPPPPAPPATPSGRFDAPEPPRASGSAPHAAPEPVLPAPASPAVPGVPLKKRISINPFERKRSVWPLVLVAAIAGGGGVYLAVAPDAEAPKPKVEEPVSPAPTPKAPAPVRKKLSPDEERDTCVASYFEPGSFKPNEHFAFLCQDGDLREITTQLFQLVRPAAPAADAAPPTAIEPPTKPGETPKADAGAHGSGLDWYELPATAIIRKGCCETATPVSLPETPGWCEQLQASVRRIADDSGKSGDLAPDARSFDKAVNCLFANKVLRSYPYDKAPSDANRALFQQFLSRAAISEARR